jgi:hypothetical protein
MLKLFCCIFLVSDIAKIMSVALWFKTTVILGVHGCHHQAITDPNAFQPKVLPMMERNDVSWQLLKIMFFLLMVIFVS